MVRPRGGEVADYIPELATADPSCSAVSLVSRVGFVYTAGDSDVAFTIQSISKPFVLALALSDLGREGLPATSAQSRAARPSTPSASIPASGVRPTRWSTPAPWHVTSLIRASGPAGAPRAHPPVPLGIRRPRARRRRGRLRLGARRRRPQPGARLPHAQRRIPRRQVDEVLDVYFRQCSLLVDASDLAVMAATLANGGPTRYRPSRRRTGRGRAVLTVMASAACTTSRASGS